MLLDFETKLVPIEIRPGRLSAMAEANDGCCFVLFAQGELLTRGNVCVLFQNLVDLFVGEMF